MTLIPACGYTVEEICPNPDAEFRHKVCTDAEIKGGAGRATLRLPRGVGVRIDVQGGLGKVNASGLKKDGDAYVNGAYGESEVTLRIDVKAGVGEIDLELGE